ncbi:MAG: hypothetical protein VB144_13275 [Clostridia bacterium]|nr:hypothetical protein [Clostridia bacterium]
MRRYRISRNAALIMLVLLFLASALSGMASAKVGSKPPKGPKPPKEKKIDCVETLRTASLKTSRGLLVTEVPAGTVFQAAEHKGNVVWVYGPSGQRYQMRRQDVRTVPGHRISIEHVHDDQYKALAQQYTILQVVAVMQAAHPQSDTQLGISMRTEWFDKVQIELAIKMKMEIPQYSMMTAWAMYAGFIIK